MCEPGGQEGDSSQALQAFRSVITSWPWVPDQSGGGLRIQGRDGGRGCSHRCLSAHTHHTLPFTPGAAHLPPSTGQLVFQGRSQCLSVCGLGIDKQPPPSQDTHMHTCLPPPVVPLSPSGPVFCTPTHLCLWVLGKEMHPRNSLQFPWHRSFSIEHHLAYTSRQELR